MDRRNFLSWVGVGFLASSLPVAIAACTSSDSTDTSTSADPPPPPPESETVAAPREDGFIEVGSLESLKTETFLKDKDFAAGPLLVIQDPSDDTKLIALNSTCPHSQCKVDWKQDDSLFVCPCHQSKFKPDGAVENGPANQPLGTFEVKTEGDLVLVKA